MAGHRPAGAAFALATTLALSAVASPAAATPPGWSLAPGPSLAPATPTAPAGQPDVGTNPSTAPTEPAGTTPPNQPAAGSGQSWSVQPAGDENGSGRAYLVHDVEPGDRFSDAIWIDNFGDRPLTLDLYAADAFNTDAGGFDVRTSAEPSSEVGLWTRPEVSVVTIQPGTRVEVPISIDVPTNATPGDHIGGIVAASVSRTAEASGRSVDIESRVGVRVYLRVDGEITPALSIEDVRYDWSSGIAPRGTLTMSYTVRNTGNVRLGAEPHVQITGPFDWKMRTPDVPPIAELLPGAQVRQQVVVDRLPAALRATASLTVLPVDTSGDLPASAEPPRVTDKVWTVPWALLVGLLAVLLAIAEWRRRVATGTGDEADGDAGADVDVDVDVGADDGEGEGDSGETGQHDDDDDRHGSAASAAADTTPADEPEDASPADPDDGSSADPAEAAAAANAARPRVGAGAGAGDRKRRAQHRRSRRRRSGSGSGGGALTTSDLAGDDEGMPMIDLRDHDDHDGDRIEATAGEDDTPAPATRGERPTTPR